MKRIRVDVGSANMDDYIISDDPSDDPSGNIEEIEKIAEGSPDMTG